MTKFNKSSKKFDIDFLISHEQRVKELYYSIQDRVPEKTVEECISFISGRLRLKERFILLCIFSDS